MSSTPDELLFLEKYEQQRIKHNNKQILYRINNAEHVRNYNKDYLLWAEPAWTPRGGWVNKLLLVKITEKNDINKLNDGTSMTPQQTI